MNLPDLRAGDSIFVDANVFIYDFGADPLYGPACKAFVMRGRAWQPQKKRADAVQPRSSG
jgi:hypothetical protein